jgi:hypothetical protein
LKGIVAADEIPKLNILGKNGPKNTPILLTIKATYLKSLQMNYRPK